MALITIVWGSIKLSSRTEKKGVLVTTQDAIRRPYGVNNGKSRTERNIKKKKSKVIIYLITRLTYYNLVLQRDIGSMIITNFSISKINERYLLRVKIKFTITLEIQGNSNLPHARSLSARRRRRRVVSFQLSFTLSNAYAYLLTAAPIHSTST